MRIIQSLKSIKQLKQLSPLHKDLLNKVDEDFRRMLNEYKSLSCKYTPEENRITVILESGDTSDILKNIVKKLSLIILTDKSVKKFLKINLNIDGITDLLLEIESEKGKDIDIGKQAFEYFLEVLNQYNKNFYYGNDECVSSTL